MTEQKKSSLQEMRDFDNQRDEDMRAIRESFAEINEQIQSSFDDINRYLCYLFWAEIAAIGAMVVTVIISLLRN